MPDDTIVIFSAHGVSKAVRAEAARRKLKVFDATCPLVTKVHLEVSRYNKDGMDCILIGHAGHPEVEGTLGQWESQQGEGRMHLVESVDDVAQLQVKDPSRLAFVTQTTLSVDETSDIIDALKQRFPEIQGPRKDDICYATQNRQDAVKQLAELAQLVLVVGSVNSSNSNRLKELAERCGAKAFLIDNAGQIDDVWLNGVDHVGVTAGASAPEDLVQGVIAYLKEKGADVIEEAKGREEQVVFSLPKALQ